MLKFWISPHKNRDLTSKSVQWGVDRGVEGGLESRILDQSSRRTNKKKWIKSRVGGGRRKSFLISNHNKYTLIKLFLKGHFLCFFFPPFQRDTL